MGGVGSFGWFWEKGIIISRLFFVYYYYFIHSSYKIVYVVRRFVILSLYILFVNTKVKKDIINFIILRQVFYVWFDAPIGYLSITANYTKDWRKWWQPSSDVNVSLYQFMAKDNVPFHSVMFPATLFAVDKNYITVDRIMSTGTPIFCII